MTSPRPAALPAAILALAVVPACAPAATVTGGSLEWGIANVFETSAPSGTNRTWLGYTTGLAAGSATDGRGTTVTPASPRGAAAIQTLRYADAGGTYDPATRRGTIDLKGTVTFRSDAHRFAITVEDPKLVLDGAAGSLAARGNGNGSMGGAPQAYDHSQPVFALDLAAAQVSGDATIARISGIVPAIATAGRVFPASSYPQGAGPDRTPNTFGGFALELRLAPAAATLRTRRVTLRKAPFASRRSQRVRVLHPRTRAVLATGAVRGRVLTLRSAERVRGTVVLRRVAGGPGRREARVRLA